MAAFLTSNQTVGVRFPVPAQGVVMAVVGYNFNVQIWQDENEWGKFNYAVVQEFEGDEPVEETLGYGAASSFEEAADLARQEIIANFRNNAE